MHLSYHPVPYIIVSIFHGNVFQVGSKIVNEDCTEEKVCVLEGGAAGFEYRDLQGCGANEVCEPKDGVRQCVCKPGFKMIDGTCQGMFITRSVL